MLEISFKVLRSVFVIMLICKEATGCLFNQRTEKREEVLMRQRKWNTKREINEDDCTCGFDSAAPSDSDKVKSDLRLEPNNPEKSWHLYIHVKSGADLATSHLRTCVGTVINSRMILTSHNCLKIKRVRVPAYEGWRPQPKNMNPTPLARPENLAVSQYGDIKNVGDDVVIEVEKIIYRSEFIFADGQPFTVHDSSLENDVAIVVIKDHWPVDILPPICIPENYTNLDPTGYQGYYYGIGGEVEVDPTPESKFVGDLTIMPGKLCNEYYGDGTFCAQYRSAPPTIVGGPFVMADNGLVNKRGFSPNHTIFLIGLASHAVKHHPGTTITSTYFTNILPLVKYLEYQANNLALPATWCKTPSFRFHGKRKNPKLGLAKLYPWEDTNSFPNPNYLERDESLDCVCGLHNLETSAGPAHARVVGGEEAKPYEFPWIASLISVWDTAADLTKKRGTTCGASFINDRVVLTAAHCVVFEERLGKFPDSQSLANRSIIIYGHHKSYEDAKKMRVNIKEMYFHRDYTLGSRQNAVPDGDVALIVLKEPMKFSRAKMHGEAKAGDIRPICLPKRNKPLDLEDKKATAAGWGVYPDATSDINNIDSWVRPDTLQKLENVPIYPLGECAKRAGISLRDSVICAGFWNREKASSRGDSGGPLIVRSHNGFWVQVGIVSFDEWVLDVNDEGNEYFKESVSLYTNVQKYLDFIDYTSRKAGAKWCKNNS